MVVPAPFPSRHVDARDRVRFVAAALAVVGFVLAIRVLLALRGSPPVESPLLGIDPNSASEADLALLPEIGERTALAILELRERRRGSTKEQALDGNEVDGIGDAGVRSGCVFRRAEDLLDVKGIGPKALEAIAPHLRFDACSSEP